MKNNVKKLGSERERSFSESTSENIFQDDKLDNQELSDTDLDVIAGGLGPNTTAFRLASEKLRKDLENL